MQSTPQPPGRQLLDALDERGWTDVDLANRMAGYPPDDLYNIHLLVNVADAPVSPSLSARIGRALGVAEDWLLNSWKSYRTLH